MRVLSSASRALSNPMLENQNEEEEEEETFNQLNLTPEQMEEFNLKRGKNEVVFSVTTQFQGRFTSFL